MVARRVAVLGFLATVVLTGCSSGPKATVEDFYSAVEAGKTSEAAELLSANTRQLLGPAKLQQAIVASNKEIKASGGVDSLKILDEQVTGDIASVNAQVTYNNGKVQSEVVNLVKEDGAWKINLTSK